MHGDKKTPSADFVNPLARAYGLGSTRSGLGHWLGLRVAGVILVPFSLWLVYALVHAGGDYARFAAWLHSPVHAVFLMMAVIPLFGHTVLGLQEVIDDYIHCPVSKLCAKIGTRALALGCIIVSIFSILKIAFAG